MTRNQRHGLFMLMLGFTVGALIMSGSLKGPPVLNYAVIFDLVIGAFYFLPEPKWEDK